MSAIQANAEPNPVRVECTMSASENYIETLTITAIKACPGLTELAIKSRLLTAKDPAEQQVKALCYVDRAGLESLAYALAQYLNAMGSSGG